MLLESMSKNVLPMFSFKSHGFWSYRIFMSLIHFEFIFPWWLRWWSVCLHCQRPGFNPWVGKISWRRKWQPTPVFLPEKSHGRRSLVGFSPRGHKESNRTRRLHFHFHGVRKCSNSILLQGAVQFSKHHLLKRLFLPHCIFLSPLSMCIFLY